MIGHQLLQPPVLALPLLQPLGLVDPQAAILAPPALVRLLGNTAPSRHLGHPLALGENHLRLPQLRDDLLCRVPLVSHANSLLPARILAQDLDRFWGGQVRIELAHHKVEPTYSDVAEELHRVLDRDVRFPRGAIYTVKERYKTVERLIEKIRQIELADGIAINESNYREHVQDILGLRFVTLRMSQKPLVVEGQGFDACGHYLPEEAPGETVASTERSRLRMPQLSSELIPVTWQGF